MIRHTVMFRWQEDTPSSDIEAALAALEGLPAAIAEVRAFSFGADAGLAEGNFDAVVVADFDDAEAYRRYAQHPEHLRVIRESLKPLIAERVAVQYMC